MTLVEYITNPAGKGSSILSTGEIKLSLNKQFENIKEKIKVLYYSKGRDIVITHVRVPSQSVEGLIYDVVFEFDLSSVTENETTINNANVHMFSNSPSFTYTYAYTFHKQELLCKWLTGKYDKIILTKEPSIRNQYKIISYEKSLYFAAKYLLSTSDKNRISYMLKKALPISNYIQVANLVIPQKQLEDIRKNIIAKLKKEKEQEKRTPEKTNKYQNNPPKKTSKIAKTTPKTPYVNKTKTVKKVK